MENEAKNKLNTNYIQKETLLWPQFPCTARSQLWQLNLIISIMNYSTERGDRKQQDKDTRELNLCTLRWPTSPVTLTSPDCMWWLNFSGSPVKVRQSNDLNSFFGAFLLLLIETATKKDQRCNSSSWSGWMCAAVSLCLWVSSPRFKDLCNYF